MEGLEAEAADNPPGVAAERPEVEVAGIPRPEVVGCPAAAVADIRQPAAVVAAQAPRMAAGRRRQRATTQLFRQRQSPENRPSSSKPPQNVISVPFCRSVNESVNCHK